MPKVPQNAVLQNYDPAAIIAEAKRRGPLAWALLSWLYEFGARASEPGLQLLTDVDLRASRAQIRHLKGGLAPSWQPLLPFCLEALPVWLQARAEHVRERAQKGMLFPSGSPGKCYTCKGSGKRQRLLCEKGTGKRTPGELVLCHHCQGTGKRWGISRIEVHGIVHETLLAAGVPPELCYPHVLRHSIITHLLEGGIPATTVRMRVGHKALQTTLGYAQATHLAGEQLTAALKDVYKR